MAGGACGGYGVLLDITDAANPKRVYAAADMGRIAQRAIRGIDGAELVDGPSTGSALDTRRAATQLHQLGCRPIVVLGGDGTCRDAVMGAPEATLVPTVLFQVTAPRWATWSAGQPAQSRSSKCLMIGSILSITIDAAANLLEYVGFSVMTISTTPTPAIAF